MFGLNSLGMPVVMVDVLDSREEHVWVLDVSHLANMEDPVYQFGSHHVGDIGMDMVDTRHALLFLVKARLTVVCQQVALVTLDVYKLLLSQQFDEGAAKPSRLHLVIVALGLGIGDQLV